MRLIHGIFRVAFRLFRVSYAWVVAQLDDAPSKTLNHKGHKVHELLCSPDFPLWTFVPFVVNALATTYA